MHQRHADSKGLKTGSVQVAQTLVEMTSQSCSSVRFVGVLTQFPNQRCDPQETECRLAHEAMQAQTESASQQKHSNMKSSFEYC